jgi:hypothetical protein
MGRLGGVSVCGGRRIANPPEHPSRSLRIRDPAGGGLRMRRERGLKVTGTSGEWLGGDGWVSRDLWGFS